MNWQPIETAPKKHCEPVLLIDEGNYCVGYWINSPPMWIEPGAGRITPTHMMPLPPPPVIKDSLTPAPPTDEELDAIQAEDAYAAARSHAYSCAKAEAEAALAQLSMDDDLDEPLGPACSRENPECESCQ